MFFPSPHPQKALKSRVAKLRQTLKPTQILLISFPTDVTYFSGFQMLVPEEREAFFLVTVDSAYLIKNGFSSSPVASEAQILDNCRPTALTQHLKKIVEKEKITEILYDPSSLFVEELRALEEGLSPSLLGTFSRDQIWALRMIKDESEIIVLKKAGQIIAQVLTEAPKFFKEGMTELEIAHQVEQRLRELGSQTLAFPTIVAFGEHSVSPHYQPAAVSLTKETSILIDAGAMINGYRSDMTRTYWFGDRPNPEFQQVEQIVQTAYQEALAVAQNHTSPFPAKQLDFHARSVIDKSGFGPQFIHTTGHGVGLDIHEPPSLSWANEQLIQPGMIITIEPGIYLPEKFGYRHENSVLITENGAQILTEV
jgi:Xaa-Pro aminopeptidase